MSRRQLVQLEGGSEEFPIFAKRDGPRPPKRRESDARPTPPEAKRRQTGTASYDKLQALISSPRRLRSQSKTRGQKTQVLGEEPWEGFRDTWYRDRREWLAEQKLKARSQSTTERILPPRARSTEPPTKNVRPYDLKDLWYEEELAARRRKFKHGVLEALKSRSPFDPEPLPREAWREAKIHGTRRPKRLGWDIIRRIVVGINEKQINHRKAKVKEEAPAANLPVMAPEPPLTSDIVMDPEPPPPSPPAMIIDATPATASFVEPEPPPPSPPPMIIEIPTTTASVVEPGSIQTSATVLGPETIAAATSVVEPGSPASIPTSAKDVREERLAEIRARFPSWVIAADQHPGWFAEVKQWQEKKATAQKAREERDRERFEEWKARGPVPRRYVAIQWEEKRLPPYLEPSEDDVIALEMQMANSGFCSVSRTEPLLLTARDGHRLALMTREESKLQYLKTVMGGLARELSSYVADDGEKPATVGFHAEYLNASSATELLGLKPPDLSAAIHPILLRDMWHDVSDEVYEVLDPALRLATQFLWHPACISHWLAVFYGDRVDDPVASAKKGAPVVRIPNRVMFSAEMAERLQREMFLSLRGKAHFKFGVGMWCNNPEMPNDGSVYGLSGGVPRFGLEPKQEDFSGAIWLNQDFLTVANRYVKLGRGANANTAERLRFNFLFAVVVVHEIAHTAVARPSYFRGDLPYGSEPIMYGEHMAEAGVSWEINTFGGRVGAIDERVDCKFGLCMVIADVTQKQKLLVWPIPMGYIEQLQQQETWSALHKYDFNSPSVIHIPKVLNPALFNGVMREPLLEFMKLHHPEVFAASALEEAILAPLLPVGHALTNLPWRDRYKLLLDRMAREYLSDVEVLTIWEVWWQYESVGYWSAIQEEKQWTLLENYWRLSGGKSSALLAKRYGKDLAAIPDRYNPLVMGAWGPAEIEEFLRKREEVLGIPVSIPWDKHEEDGTTSNSNDTPPHERDEFRHHPSGYKSPENPFRFLFLQRPGESKEDFDARVKGDPMVIDHTEDNIAIEILSALRLLGLDDFE